MPAHAFVLFCMTETGLYFGKITLVEGQPSCLSGDELEVTAVESSGGMEMDQRPIQATAQEQCACLLHSDFRILVSSPVKGIRVLRVKLVLMSRKGTVKGKPVNTLCGQKPKNCLENDGGALK